MSGSEVGIVFRQVVIVFEGQFQQFFYVIVHGL